MLNNRKSSLSATYKKNAEANDRAYDMNQKTIQASDALAEEYSAFEASMKKVTSEHEEGDVLHARATEVTDELERAPKGPGPSARRTGLILRRHGQRCQGILQLLGCARSSKCKNKQRRETCNRRATREATCVEARKAWQRTYDFERKASEAQENVFSHTERTRRFSNEHARAKGLVKDALGSLGQAVRAAAQATH